MKKGTILTDVYIQALGYGGVGISVLPDGKKILVSGALPQSIVDIKIIKSKKDYLEGHIVRVKNISPDMATGEVRCPHYLFSYHTASDTLPAHKVGCGGCKWQVVSYDKQLQLKRDIVSDCFKKILTQNPHIIVSEVLPSPQTYQYRNKMEFSFGKFLQRSVDGGSSEFQIAEHRNLGLHKQGEFSKVIDIDQCFLVSETMHKVFSYIKTLCRSSGLPVYDAKTHQGFFRHLVLREGVHTGQLLVILSVAPKYLQESPSAKQLWGSMLTSCKEDAFLREHVTTFLLNETDQLADAIVGQESHQQVLWGGGSIFEKLQIGDVETTFQISPFSFFQTNTRGAELLFATARDMLIHKPQKIIDLYCGSGTIGLAFLNSGLGEELIGVDIVASAIYDANKNAQINNLQDRTMFYAGKAEQIVHQHLRGVQLHQHDLIVVDPPREGMHPGTIEFILQVAELQKFQLCYISCNPKTMARDIELLVAGGLTLHSIQPVDMFPHTHHIETISLLTRD